MKITVDKEVLEHALDALEDVRGGQNYDCDTDRCDEAISAIREVLAQPERKPLTDEEIGMAFLKAFPVGGVVFTNEVLAQPEPAVQGEPVGEVLNEKGEVDWISFVPPIGANLYTTPQPAVPERHPLTEEEIVRLVPGLLDCLCDPWDYNNSGDYYASIPKDMIRLARAVEAHHGITGENK